MSDITNDVVYDVVYDDDEDFDAFDEPLTHEMLANVDVLVRKQAEVEAVEDPEEQIEAARWYYAALAGYEEPAERWS